VRTHLRNAAAIYNVPIDGCAVLSP